MDRPGVPQVPEGSGEQRKMEKTGCKIICDAPMTLVVKRQMMMLYFKTQFGCKQTRSLEDIAEIVIF